MSSARSPAAQEGAGNKAKGDKESAAAASAADRDMADLLSESGSEEGDVPVSGSSEADAAAAAGSPMSPGGVGGSVGGGSRGDTIVSALTSADMLVADDAVRLLVAAVLGLPTGDAEYDRTMESVSRSARVAEALDSRLQVSGLVDPAAGDSADSRLAEVFVHITNRIARLSRYHACQLEFLGHCVVAAAAVYAARSEAVVKLFPDTVYASAAAVHGLLRRIGMTAPAPAAAAAGVAADKGGVRARPGKGTGAAATPAAEDTAGATGTAASAAPAADAVAASPAAAGLRKACIAFLHATSASLPGIEASIIADKESPQEDREYVQAQALAAKVAETLSQTPARAVVAEAGEAVRAHASGYKGGMSSLYAFFAAPLLIVASLAGVALLWSPQLLPEAVLAHPLVAQATRLQPQYEWVRYAGSAVAAAFVLLLLAQMVTYTGVQALPARQASVHALLASDGDVAALLEGRAGDTPVDFALLGGGEPEGQKGKGKPAAKEEVAAADAAPASGKGSQVGKKGGKGAAAATSPAAGAAAATSPSAGAGAEASPAAAGGEEEDDGVDWCLSMGLPRETLDGMLWAFEHASSVQQSVEEHEAATAAAEEAAAAAADGAAAGATAAAGADGGAAASPAAAPAGAASASPPEQLVVDIPDGLLESLATLSLKLEELGETELAGQVMARYSFVAGLLRANGYAIEGEEAGEGYAEGEGEGAEGSPAGEGEGEDGEEGAPAARSSGEGGAITAAATGAASE